jgi:predicted SAM-dependent methyltransferase
VSGIERKSFVLQKPLKLNLGCGPIQAATWVNVDGSNRAWLASRLPWLDRLIVALRLVAPTEFGAETLYANLLRPFPWKDNDVEAIYMGEILEHFTQEEGKRVLRECYRVLKPGGVLRIRVPDNAHFWKTYIENYESTKQKTRGEWCLTHTRWTAMYFQDICVRRPRLWQSMGHYHKWAYDEISLILMVESLGFQNVERKTFHQSRIPHVEEVEMTDMLIVEAVCP